MSKPNTRSGSKSNDGVAPASSTRPPSTKAIPVPPRPKPRSKASSKVSVTGRRKRTEEDVVDDDGDGEDDHAALTAKIVHLERQLKSNASNVKAKAAQERLETEREASRKRTRDMLDAEGNAEEDADSEDLDTPLLLTKKARQRAVDLDDDEDALMGLMQDDLDNAEHQPEDGEDAWMAYTQAMDDMLIEDDKYDTPPPCTQPRSKVLSTSSRSSTPLSELGSLSKKERGLLQNLPDKAGIIAAMGHRMLRIHVATVDGFPATTSKDDVAWSCLVDAVGDIEGLKRNVEDIKLDPAVKESVLNYIWGACSQLRGELVSKARQKVSASYSIPGTLSTTKVSQTVQWMLKTDAFIYDKLDMNNMSFDKNTPFCNALLKDLFISQWFGSRGEGIKYADSFKNVPDCILALMASAIECALNAWITGVRSQIKFSDTQFRHRYSHYMKKLKFLGERCPTWLKQFKKELYLKVCKESGHELLGLQASDSEEETNGMDWEAMEKDAMGKKVACDDDVA